MEELNQRSKPIGISRLQSLITGKKGNHTSKKLLATIHQLADEKRILQVAWHRGFGWISLEKGLSPMKEYQILADLPSQKDYAITTDDRARAVVLATTFAKGNGWQNVRVRLGKTTYQLDQLETMP